MNKKWLLWLLMLIPLGGIGLAGWAVYILLHSLLFVLAYFGVSVLLAGGMVWLTRGSTSGRRAMQLLKEKAEEDQKHAFYQALSHLTVLDERWLADRHFWVPPKEVCRIRAGQPWNEPWVWGNGTGVNRKPLQVQHREELETRAKFARGVFEGDNIQQTPQVVQQDPIEGEIVMDSQSISSSSSSRSRRSMRGGSDEWTSANYQ